MFGKREVGWCTVLNQQFLYELLYFKKNQNTFIILDIICLWHENHEAK